jgi:hypothetical protein
VVGHVQRSREAHSPDGFFFACGGIALQLLEAIIRTAGAVVCGQGYPDWANLDIADYAIGWTIGGLLVGVTLLIITRPRNAAIATVFIGGGILVGALGGTMLLASAPDNIDLVINMFGADVVSLDLTSVKRSIADRLPNHPQLNLFAVTIADLAPTILALTAGVLLFWLLTRLVPAIVNSSRRRGGDD